MLIRGILIKLISLTLSGLWAAGAFAASWSIEDDPQGSWQRIVLDETVYAQLGRAHPQVLHVRDGDGQEVPHALCARPLELQDISAEIAPVLLARGVRARIGADGQVERLQSPGVSLNPPWVRAIVDLRAYPGPVQGIDIPAGWSAANLSLRSSPDLRQWSRPLVTEVSGQQVRLKTPTPVAWLAVDLAPEQMATPETIRVLLLQENPDSALHWYRPVADGTPAYTHTRALPVRGVRPAADAVALLDAFSVASRLGPGDAWKSRGRWSRDQGGAPRLSFAGVGDGQWRVDPVPADADVVWEFGHQALELRISGDPKEPLRLTMGQSAPATRPCQHPDFSGPAAVRTIGAMTGDRVPGGDESDASRNLRPWFLLFAVPLLLIWLIWVQRRKP